MPDDDSLLAQFRQAERDHTNGRNRRSSRPGPMELVTLRGGPLNGLRRHVRRNATRVRFQRPLGDGRYWYECDEQGEWRWVEK